MISFFLLLSRLHTYSFFFNSVFFFVHFYYVLVGFFFGSSWIQSFFSLYFKLNFNVSSFYLFYRIICLMKLYNIFFLSFPLSASCRKKQKRMETRWRSEICVYIVSIDIYFHYIITVYFPFLVVLLLWKNET